jgi:hypothetical protein
MFGDSLWRIFTMAINVWDVHWDKVMDKTHKQISKLIDYTIWESTFLSSNLSLGMIVENQMLEEFHNGN